MMMPNRRSLLLSAALFASGVGFAQTPAPPPPTASSMLSPALEQLRQAISDLRLDKWKAPGPVREQTSGNMGSITRDLDATLPALLATADGAPGAVSKNLPVFRNVDALYDVLLRIVETADLSAPEDEADRLHTALTALDDARRSLGDAMESAAASQEQRIAALEEQARATVARQPDSATEVVDDSAKPATHKHKAAVKKTPPPPAQQQ